MQTKLVNYTLVAVDAVTGQDLKVHYPALSPLMAQAWAELCFENNAWSAAALWTKEECIWTASK